MGKQMIFYMDAQDEEKFVAFLHAHGVRIYWVKERKAWKEVDTLPDMTHNWTYQMWLYREDFGNIQMKRTDQGLLSIDPFRSYLLEFYGSRIDHHKK